MADVVRNAQWNARVAQRLILFITFIAVALSAVGLYAVTAHGVAQRTQEIGVRMALGARPGQVVRLIARRVLMQLALGFVGGIACTLVWARLFSTGRSDLTLAAAALLASLVPARRAIRLDPGAAMRGD
jgi:ABC-type antimicrobial peptide transport system permease subunit